MCMYNGVAVDDSVVDYVYSDVGMIQDGDGVAYNGDDMTCNCGDMIAMVLIFFTPVQAMKP